MNSQYEVRPFFLLKNYFLPVPAYLQIFSCVIESLFIIKGFTASQNAFLALFLLVLMLLK